MYISLIFEPLYYLKACPILNEISVDEFTKTVVSFDFQPNILFFRTQTVVVVVTTKTVQPISNGAELRTYSIYSSSLKSQYIVVPYTMQYYILAFTVQKSLPSRQQGGHAIQALTLKYRILRSKVCTKRQQRRYENGVKLFLKQCSYFEIPFFQDIIH